MTSSAVQRMGLDLKGIPDESEKDLRTRKIRSRVEALSTLIEKLDMDFIPVGEVSPMGWRTRMIDENTWVDEWGAKWRYRDGIKWYVGGALKGAEDFQSLEFPDPYAPGRMDEAEMLVKRFKGKSALFGCLVGQKIPHLARGLDGYTVDLYRNPRLAKKFMEVTTKYNIEIGKLLIDQGVDVICMGGDLRAPEKRAGVCPFCPGNEHMMPPAVLVYLPFNGGVKKDRDQNAFRHKNWLIRCVPNLYPACMQLQRK